MALPAVAAKAGGALGGLGGGGEKPKALSPEGIGMITIAVIFGGTNFILGFLDFAVVGIFLSPVVNLVGTGLIGGWLWMRTGKPPYKKSLLPLIGNSIPIIKFFPLWFISVVTSLDWGNTPKPTQKEPQPEPAQ